MRLLKTSELADRAGVNVETLRFYERKGLLPEPPRRQSGYRQYSEEFVTRVRFIKRAQAVGFSLEEIKDLLALRVQPGTTCVEVRQRAEHKIEDVRQKIADLKAIEQALITLSTSCTGQGPVSQCPILEALDGDYSILTR